MRHATIAAIALAIVSTCACSRGGSANAGNADNAEPPAAGNAAPQAGVAKTPAAYAAAGDTSAATADTTPADQSPSSTRAGIVVNGVALDTATETALTQAYGAIPPGAYWYDPVSGLVGLAGGPSSARILPNLPLGGPLQANASGGGDGRMTGVFINGREIHVQEVMRLTTLFGAINPGRYWLGPDFVGGFEGGPPAFDLKASARASANGGPGYNKSTLFGDLMSDGQCSGYFDPSSGSSVMTGNC